MAIQGLAPPSVSSAPYAIAASIRQAILEGKLVPGQRLLQDELAAALLVSRQPVREALNQLIAEGLVVKLPNRSVVVREQSDEDVRQNYYLRGLLEAEAAGFAALRVTDDHIRHLRSLNRRLAQASGAAGPELTDLNRDFHFAIHKAAGIPVLERFIRQLWVGRTVFTPLFIADRRRSSAAEHEDIIEAIAAHDQEASAKAMRSHVNRGESSYFARGAEAVQTHEGTEP